MTQVDEKVEPIRDQVLRRNAGEAEFHQASRCAGKLGRIVAKHPGYTENALIERICVVFSRAFELAIQIERERLLRAGP